MTARSDFRLVSFLVAAALWVVGCGEPQPPVAMGSIPGLAVEVGNTVSVDLTGYFSDADGDILSYRATSSHSRVQVSVSGASVQVTAVAAGTATVTVTATDPGGLSAEQEFPVTVPNRAPEAVGRMPDAETFVGESVEVALADHFGDPDGDALAYAATSADEGVATVGVTGSTLRVAGVGQGVATVTVTATDPGGLSAEQEFPVTVPNRAPEAV
ncbi:MAG: Ig-like domain-containing protein, partial [Gemmatimonadota bacterium]|nr:Ig-like domain-containing protein [Gemmatimonadota bacterium]